MSKWFSTDIIVEYPSPSTLDGYATYCNRNIDYKIFFPNVDLPGRVKCKIKATAIRRGSTSKFALIIKCKSVDDLLLLKLTV